MVLHKEDVVHIYNGILLGQKRSEILPFAITWVDLGDNMLREVSQTKRDTYLMIALICGV